MQYNVLKLIWLWFCIKSLVFFYFFCFNSIVDRALVNVLRIWTYFSLTIHFFVCFFFVFVLSHSIWMFSFFVIYLPRIHMYSNPYNGNVVEDCYFFLHFSSGWWIKKNWNKRLCEIHIRQFNDEVFMCVSISVDETYQKSGEKNKRIRAYYIHLNSALAWKT